MQARLPVCVLLVRFEVHISTVTCTRTALETHLLNATAQI